MKRRPRLGPGLEVLESERGRCNHPFSGQDQIGCNVSNRTRIRFCISFQTKIRLKNFSRGKSLIIFVSRAAIFSWPRLSPRPEKSFFDSTKISLNQTNLCIDIRSKKSFLDLKKFLDCFFPLN